MKYYLKVLQNYATFKGRARRSEFWYFCLFNGIIYTALIIFSTIAPEMGLVYGIYWLATIIPYLAVGVRRMHDTGKSGWFLLIPLYNLILCCTDGDIGANKYGDDPKPIE